MAEAATHGQVQDYYGKVLKTSEDLKTNACCPGERPPRHIIAALKNVHEEVRAKYYGCGLTLPIDSSLKGLRVLDLGCGAGQDCFTISQLVGPTGLVVGVDMTEEQIKTAQKHVPGHMEAFGFPSPNVKFLLGFIEELDELRLEEKSFDLIISNCVINLSPDKEKVLRQVHRLLAEGGEMYFSDIYSDRRIPSHLRDDQVLYGECLSGAMYWNDFLQLARKVGFSDPRLVTDRPITINNDCVKQKLGSTTNFFSATFRLFKIEGLELSCEDYGQAVIYKGTMDYMPDVFVLDGHHRIEKGRVFAVCRNTYLILKSPRFVAHFDFVNESSTTHFGIFPGCGSSIPFQSASSSSSSGSCAPASSSSCC
eukprot:TRINITY_DN1272_c0_g1_i1.p1 TRINITY_DN1272_c0_g1~~TRINITY_DN1272_c0_g1_i1.p1  ORF type:complete len:366 (-),score=122.13 TRINITY_DN1272_c0_g1_i1:56-1153(-)